MNSQKKDQLIVILCDLKRKYSSELEDLKKESSGLARNDFLWHYLLQSFSTMGRSQGSDGLIKNEANYEKLRFENLAAISHSDREEYIASILRKAKVRWPNRKAGYIVSCFDQITSMGGLLAAKNVLLNTDGRENKIRFLSNFKGISEKYARNIMMDVYHEDFHQSIAIDTRIQAITSTLGLHFNDYKSHEEFYLEVAKLSGLNGWELDRLLYNHYQEIISRVS